MEIIPKAEADIFDLLKRLSDSQILVMPTETAYGLIADSTNQPAVERIYKIKQRDLDKPLPVVCNNLEMVKKYFDLTSVEEELAVRYWPGPLSIKLQQRGEIKANIAGGEVIVRVTSNKFLQDLMSSFNKPLTATSANLSSQPVCYSVQKFIAQMGLQEEQPDLVIEAGLIPEIMPSTIIEVKDKEIKILRQGPIKISK